MKIEEKLETISSSLETAETDEDAKRKANKEIKQLKQSLEVLEKEKELPQLITEFNGYYDEVNGLVTALSDQTMKETAEQQLRIIKSDAESAIEHKDKTLLIQARNQVFNLGVTALQTAPSYWVDHYYKIENGDITFSNQEEATYYINKGKKAIDQNDNDELERCVRSLWKLMPPDKQNQMHDIISGITDKK